MSRPTRTEPSLPEWAALGLLCEAPAHGWAIAEALGPTGDIGRVYSCTRPLLYRALRQLQSAGLAEVRGTTTSDAGPARTILGATRRGRAAFDRWRSSPAGARARSPLGAHAEAPLPRPSRHRPQRASSRPASGSRAHGGGAREAAEVCGRLRPDACVSGGSRSAVQRSPSSKACSTAAPSNRSSTGRSATSLAAHRIQRDAAASRSPTRAARRRSRSRVRTVDASRISRHSRTFGCSPTSTRAWGGTRRCDIPRQRQHGTFATRSPRRPNPVGLSLARIVSVGTARVVVEGLDLLDGTPVLDLKPFVPLFDTASDDVRSAGSSAVPTASSRARRTTASRSAAAEHDSPARR